MLCYAMLCYAMLEYGRRIQRRAACPRRIIPAREAPPRSLSVRRSLTAVHRSSCPIYIAQGAASSTESGVFGGVRVASAIYVGSSHRRDPSCPRAGALRSRARGDSRASERPDRSRGEEPVEQRQSTDQAQVQRPEEGSAGRQGDGVGARRFRGPVVGPSAGHALRRRLRR
jgi:hypothetical protein